MKAEDEWWRGCVIYQVYPRSFQDTTGDGVGDLAGVTKRLAYIASLGVDVVWLSPFFKSPMADMGYDVEDFCAVDPMFGTMDDFDRLIAEAHRLGLKVIIDQVLSHVSERHAWFVESRRDRTNPKADWFVWAEPKKDGTPPNNWLSVFGGSAWEWDGTRRQYYLHNFLASQPDLNFHNRQVQDAVLETVRFWLERGVDGFRLDAVNYYFHDRRLRDNPPLKRRLGNDVPETNPYGYQDHVHDKSQPENIAYLRRFRALLKEYGAHAAVGEVGDGDRSLKTVAEYTAGSDLLQMCYTFDLLGPEFSAAHVRKCIEGFENTVCDGWVCWSLSNHDVPRHATRLTPKSGDPDRTARFAILLLAALRGSICLYQGEELGLEEAEIAWEDLRDPYGIRFWPAFKGRDGCRTPMVWEHNAKNAGFSTGRPWLPVPGSHAVAAVDVQEKDRGSVLAWYRRVLALRHASSAFRAGTLRFLSSGRDVLLFERRAAGEAVLCAFNFSDAAAKVRRPSGADEVLLAVGGHSFGKKTLTLAGRSAVVVRIA